eukprot:CAMPEP_0198316300 /NCGR_PEP_ID=MMETSP1450-20131203/6247_1 /TAXON_ID=753684 ORGANISM="Madagascaria erythrocladiodes, Strain CCMP3234" /NCGR_SAMPLE_ID=MMETSP1450 /ASSEMBLY_ACC=CAM_ASM_001115 /LENGTH=456 /DNA_ID=CAMNT_0044019451 /DNA_START=68 /DNA_END=1434 /DNA_ORIENTATION=-
MAVTAGIVLTLALLSSATAQLKPNVLLWMTDDISFKDFEFGGSTAVSTPNLNRLGREGVNFRKAWATPVCRPSRGMIMSGALPQATGWWDQPTIPNNIGLTYGTFAHVAKTAGYRTMMAGKFQLKGKVKDHGFDEYCMWEHSDLMTTFELRAQFVAAGGDAVNKTERGTGVQNRYWQPLLVRHDGVNYNHFMYPPDDNLFGPHIITECIIDFMTRMKESNTPWIIYFPGLTAHQHWDNVLKKQAYIAMPILDEDFNIMGRENEGEGSLESNIEYLDAMAGHITKKIEELGIKDKTVFVFTSDNGTNNYGKKSLASEFGPHVPHIVWGGPVKQRGFSNRLVSLIDWYRTIVEWTGGTEGVRPGVTVESKRKNSLSLARYLKGNDKKRLARKWMLSWLEENEWFFRSKNFILDANNDLWDCRNDADERTCIKVAPDSSASAERQYRKLNLRKQEIIDT